MQAVDLAATLALALFAHPPGECERHSEDRLQRGLVGDLATDVADQATELGAQRSQRPIGALELLGMDIALMHDHRLLADARVGLSQPYRVLAGQSRQSDDISPCWSR